ncbi:hypothetical protein D9M72_432550 [compost metagenome]
MSGRMTLPPPWSPRPWTRFRPSTPAEGTARAWTTFTWAAPNRAVKRVPTWRGWSPSWPDWIMFPAQPSTGSAPPACRPSAWRSMPSRRAKVTPSWLPAWSLCPVIRTGPGQEKPTPATTTRASTLPAAGRRPAPRPTRRGPIPGWAAGCRTSTSRWDRLRKTWPPPTVFHGPSRMNGLS